MILSLFRRRPKDRGIEPLYGAIMAEGLNPRLYAALGVPDTFEGRFEAVTLAASVVLHRLKADPPPADEAAQELVNRLFDGFDSAMREVGISDVGVPKRMKKFGQAFYGRLAAYSAAFENAGADALGAALGKNLLEGAPPSPDLLAHVAGYRRRVLAASLDEILAGRFGEKGNAP